MEKYLRLDHFSNYQLNFSTSSTYVPSSRLLEQARKKCFQIANSSGLLANPFVRKYVASASSVFKRLNSRTSQPLDERKPEVIAYLKALLKPEYSALFSMDLNLDPQLWSNI